MERMGDELVQKEVWKEGVKTGIKIEKTKKFKELTETEKFYFSVRMEEISDTAKENACYDLFDQLELDCQEKGIPATVLWKILDYNARRWKAMLKDMAEGEGNQMEAKFLDVIMPPAEEYNQQVVDKMIFDEKRRRGKT